MTAGRPDVVVLATGGTVSMAGAGTGGGSATPVHGAAALLAMPGVVPDGLTVEAADVTRLPGAHLSADDLLEISGAVREASARAARGVVVLVGTDVLEELAVLLDLAHEGPSPVVVTGAIRPASAVGADGPANLRDALLAASAESTRGAGVLACFGGELHAARLVTKASSTSPSAFASPAAGPVGHLSDTGARMLTRPLRWPTVHPRTLAADVRIHHVTAAERPEALRAVAAGADGLVVAALGAGHVAPGTIAELERLAASMPVVATSRVAAPLLLHGTYGFRGAEADLRAIAIPADPLTPQAARMVLMAGLEAGLDGPALRALFSPDSPITP